jgi:hypothetical protein
MMSCVYLVIFVGALSLVTGYFIGMIIGTNKEHDLWLDRGYVMKKRRKK